MENYARIIHGGCIEKMREMPDASVDAIVADPPYGLANVTGGKIVTALTRWVGGERDFVPDGRGFMGNAWDGFVPPPAVWDEALRVLKPGGFLVAFAGDRTYDLMGLSVRLAGFEIMQGLFWARTGGMIKTGDLGAMMDKAGLAEADRWRGFRTSIKPAVEPMVLARKPVKGSAIRSIAEHGVGGLNVDACRVPHRSEADYLESVQKNRHGDFGTRHGGNDVYGDFSMLGARSNYDAAGGRLPSNLMLDAGQADALDRQSGITRSRKGKPREGTAGEGWGSTHTGSEYDDIGGASRFFHIFDDIDTRLIYAPRANRSERVSYIDEDGRKVQHPTVKPLQLMRHIVRLVTPPGGTVLDPFGGSGTTAEAALLENLNTIVIEREKAYIPLIEQRLARVQEAGA